MLPLVYNDSRVRSEPPAGDDYAPFADGSFETNRSDTVNPSSW